MKDPKFPDIRLSRVLNGIKDGTHGTFTRVPDSGVPLLSAKNVLDDRVILGDTESRISEDDAAQICAIGFPRKHDVLLTIVGTIGRSAIYSWDKPLPFQRSVAFLRPRPALLLPRFLKFSLDSKLVQDQMLSLSKAAAQPGIYLSGVSSVRLPLPSIDSQHQIADYLDHETAEIDALVSDLQQTQKLFEERRISTLGDAIKIAEQGGLTAAAEEGLVPIKHLATITLGKMLDTTALKPDDTMHRYLRAANVQPAGRLALDDLKSMRFSPRERAQLTLHAGDVVVVEGGVGGYGRAAYVPNDLEDVGFQNSIIRLRPTSGNDGRYLAYALILLRARGYIETVASVASMPHFTVEKVATTPVPVMSADQQREVSDRLDRIWASTEAMALDALQAIDLARERRAALISAAVTGQIDVTGRRRGPSEAERLEAELADSR